MNRSMLGVIGMVALVAMGAGCSKSGQSRPVKQAQAKHTPTFESSVPEGQTNLGQTGPMSGAQVGQGTGGMGERELCSSLSEHGQLRVENVEGGVAIIAAPKQGVDLQKLRTDALHVAYMISPPSGEQHARPTSASDRCPLFDLGTVTGRSSVIEQGNEVRILILARDTTDVSSLRQETRQFVQQWQK